MPFVETAMVLEQPYPSRTSRRDQTDLVTRVIRSADQQTAVISDRVVESYSHPLRRGFDDTIFPSEEDWELFADSQEESPLVAEDAGPDEVEADSAWAQLSDQRITLLKRKYRATLSPEQAARLQVLTERLLGLLPVATSEDYEVLSSMMGRAAEIDSETQAAWDRIRAL